MQKHSNGKPPKSEPLEPRSLSLEEKERAYRNAAELLRRAQKGAQGGSAREVVKPGSTSVRAERASSSGRCASS
jgi:hypothetical protein